MTFSTLGLTSLRKGYIMPLHPSPVWGLVVEDPEFLGMAEPQGGKGLDRWSQGGRLFNKLKHSHWAVKWTVKLYCVVPLSCGDLFVTATRSSITYTSTLVGPVCLCQGNWWAAGPERLVRCNQVEPWTILCGVWILTLGCFIWKVHRSSSGSRGEGGSGAELLLSEITGSWL